MSANNKDRVAHVSKAAQAAGCFDGRDNLVAFTTGFAAATAATKGGAESAAFNSGFAAGATKEGAGHSSSGCAGCSNAWKINVALGSELADQGRTKRFHKVKGENLTGLMVKNSLTSNDEGADDDLVPFVVTSPGTVKWYICGPTVYAPSHLGHARAYLTFDIIRGILEEYFGYSVSYAMNVTDIDDKIIKRAREGFLFKRWTDKNKDLTPSSRSELLAAAKAFVAEKKAKQAEFLATKDTAMAALLGTQAAKAEALVAAIEGAADAQAYGGVVQQSRTALSTWLDKSFKESGEELDNKIFEELPRKFEKQFFEDMQALGVKPPTVVTRISEYVEDVVKYIEKIIANGYAYESGGSVYFDTQKFEKVHNYRKLCPPTGDAKADAALLADGEGALAAGNPDKQHANDFVLWKKSKSGEPHWTSPWGEGRPGWHIECSVMASHIFGENMDIHSGGIDLRFPHHDNEMAQAEAYFENHQWVNYWFHAGHLHIEGLKMSKSLKNFVSIREAIDPETGSTTPRALRILFLLNAWDKPLNFSETQLEQANTIEKRFSNFFNNIKVELRGNSAPTPKRWTEGSGEQALWNRLHEIQVEVHKDLQNNFKTQPVIVKLQDLVALTNKYMESAKGRTQGYLLLQVAGYVTKIFKAFGLIGRGGDDWLISEASPSAARGLGFQSKEGASSGKEEALSPILAVLSKFRNAVRQAANKNQELLNLCDEARAELVDCGVQLQDRGEGACWIFLSEAEKRQLKKEDAEKRVKAEAKAKRKVEAARKAAAAAATEKVAPQELFKDPSKYGTYDDTGLPLTAADGTEISKSARKKLAKKLKAYTKKYNKSKK